MKAVKKILGYFLLAILIIGVLAWSLHLFRQDSQEKETTLAFQKLCVESKQRIDLLEKTLAQQEIFILAKQGADYKTIDTDLKSIHGDLLVMNLSHPSPVWYYSNFSQVNKQLGKIMQETENIGQDTQSLQKQHATILETLANKDSGKAIQTRRCRPVEMENSNCRP